MQCLLRLTRQCLAEGRHILVLSERRRHLETFAGVCKDAGIDAGLYYGGLKQATLDASVTKRVILGTFNMISEGFDLKSLDTLILATPKSDIVQAVGRILRQGKGRRTIPRIIDVVDDTDFYKGMFQKRKRYYLQQKFRILSPCPPASSLNS